MKTLYAMRRANGDWFAVEDGRHSAMLVFNCANDAMVARSRDSGMECFRPVAIDANAVDQLKVTEGGTASFLIVSEPLRKLNHARRVGFAELALLMVAEEPRL